MSAQLKEQTHASPELTPLEGALSAAREGFWQFPVYPDGAVDKRGNSKAKRPRVNDWQTLATLDPLQIERWAERFNGCNFGTYTGKFGPAGDKALLVVDGDVKRGKKGDQGVVELELEGKYFSATRTHDSPSGGWHWLYVVDKPVKGGVDVLGEGLDIRSHGNLVLTPCSVVDGKHYRVRPDEGKPFAGLAARAVHPAPQWLIDACGAPRAKALDRTPLAGVDPDRARQRGIDYLATAPEAIEGAGGDNCTYGVATKLLALGNDPGAAFDLMASKHWHEGCGWTPEELIEKIAHAERYMQDPIGTDAPEAAFEAVEASGEPAPTWNADKIRAEASAIYTLHGRDSVAYNKLAQCWTMLDVIEPGELQSLLADAALASVGVGPAAAAASTPEDAKLQRGLAMLQAKNPEAYGWARDELKAHGMPKRASANAAKGGKAKLDSERNAAARAKDGRTVVMHQPGNLAATADDVEAALLADEAHESVFRYAGRYAAVRHAAPVSVRELSDGGDYPAMAIVHRYDTASMTERVSRSIRLEVPGRDGAPPKAIAPPETVVKMLLSRAGGKAPVLTGIIEAPTLRADGSLLEAEGYDEATGLFGVFGGRVFDMGPVQPTQDDAKKALAFLQDELFAEFPFSEDVDRAAAVAAVLTDIVRPTLCESAPGFLLSSPAQSSGKTALAQTIFYAAFGRPASAQSWPSGNDEMAKFLLGALGEGQRGVIFDNLPVGTAVENDQLAAAMTSETYSARRLGHNENVTVPTAVLWMLTGNNVTPAGDMPTRLIEVYIDAKEERPEQRTFTRDLKAWLPLHRQQIITAALTLLRAYVAAGRPAVASKPTRFHRWDAMVRLPILCAGGADVGEKFAKAVASDPSLEALGNVLQRWREVFGNREALVSDAIREAPGPAFETTAAGELVDALRQATNARHRELSALSVGKYLAKHMNRTRCGLRLERRQNRDGVSVWHVGEVAGG